MARIYYIRDQKNIHTKKDGKPSRGVPVAVICTDLDKENNEILFAFSVAYKAPKDAHLTCAECGYSNERNEHEVAYIPANTFVSGTLIENADSPLVKKEFECVACGSKKHAHEKSDHFIKARGRDMAMSRLNKKQCFAIKNIPTEGGNKAIVMRVMECIANRDDKGKFRFSKESTDSVYDSSGNFPMRIRKFAAAWLDRGNSVKQLPEKKLVDVVKTDNKTAVVA